MNGIGQRTAGHAALGAVLAGWLLAALASQLAAQTRDESGGTDVRHDRGQLVAPVYEGWYRDAKGNLNLSFGFLNRNFREELDIPVGPDNKIEPGPADQGQPTHFVPRRQWGAFSVVVEPELERRLIAEKKTVTWTLKANGQVASVPANIGPAYAIDALREPTVGNEPPELRFAQDGPSGAGPLGIKTTMTAVAGVPTKILMWVHDDGRALPQKKNAGVELRWTRYRGPGAVQFADATPVVVGTGQAAVTATFAEPGEYALRVEAIDNEIHDFQCCWSNGYVYAVVSAAKR